MKESKITTIIGFILAFIGGLCLASNIYLDGIAVIIEIVGLILVSIGPDLLSSDEYEKYFKED